INHINNKENNMAIERRAEWADLDSAFAQAARQIRDAEHKKGPYDPKLVIKMRLITLENLKNFQSYKEYLGQNRENPNVQYVAGSVNDYLKKDIFTRKKPATVNELRNRSFCERIVTPIAVAAIVAAGAFASSFL
ncbi:MAG: hypothetical protein JXA94_06145, partial [Parachlamydiales bacterium]|nr:hypothetical protein [Parachlamydiales bacterium]